MIWGGGAVNFIHFEKTANCSYPIGGEFNDNFDYIREAARTLHTVVDKDEDIALVCRGTSGCIIAGAVGYILKKKGGNTVGEILKDLDDFIKWDTYPFLCTANFLDESVLIRREW